MVSIRRRRSLGLCSGKNSSLVVVPKPTEIRTADENSSQHVKPVSVHPMPSVEMNLQQPVNKSEMYLGSTDEIEKEELNPCYPGKEIKHRKRHRRKHYENQEPCIMRGVYFKNMKWQAAIKVDKKQIHLGTVGSQEEAARLYDSFHVWERTQFRALGRGETRTKAIQLGRVLVDDTECDQ